MLYCLNLPKSKFPLKRYPSPQNTKTIVYFIEFIYLPSYVLHSSFCSTPPFYPLDSISEQTKSEKKQQQPQQENNSLHGLEIACKSWRAQNVCQQVQREMPSADLCANIKDRCKVQTCSHEKKGAECAGMQ